MSDRAEQRVERVAKALESVGLETRIHKNPLRIYTRRFIQDGWWPLCGEVATLIADLLDEQVKILITRNTLLSELNAANAEIARLKRVERLNMWYPEHEEAK